MMLKTTNAVHYLGKERTFDELLASVGPEKVFNTKLERVCDLNRALEDAAEAAWLLATMSWLPDNRESEQEMVQRLRNFILDLRLNYSGRDTPGIFKGGH